MQLESVGAEELIDSAVVPSGKNGEPSQSRMKQGFQRCHTVHCCGVGIIFSKPIASQNRGFVLFFYIRI